MPTRLPHGRQSFTRRHRVGHARDFQAAFANRLSRTRGPLVIHARRRDELRPAQSPDTPPPRLGLSVSRRVGNAVKRNRIKRRLREAFRLHRAELPPGVDLVISVRPHETLAMAEYTRLLVDAAAALARDLHSRPRRPSAPPERPA